MTKDINAARDTHSGGGGMDKKVIDRRKPCNVILCFLLCFIFLVSPVYAAGSLRIEKISTEVNLPQIKYHVAYPRISGLKDENTQHKLNVAFMENAVIARTKAEYEAKSTAVNGGVDYEVKRNQDGILSIVMKSNTSYSGSNLSEQNSVTINTVTGRRYLLSDLFVDNADYAATLSGQIKAQIKTNKVKAETSFKKISEDADYYLTADSIVIYFKQGKYFSTSDGIKEFKVPLRTLDGILRPQFIIKK